METLGFYIGGLMMGLIGGLHCIGMCGPIVLMLRGGSKDFMVYGIAKSLPYILMGMMVGAFGWLIRIGGFQQYLSLLAGVLLLLFVMGMKIKFLSGLGQKVFGFFERQGLQGSFWIGFGSGFLPCGLVYGALAASLVGGSPYQSGLFMLLFGIGTLPSLFILHVLKRKIALSSSLLLRIQRGSMVVIALLLMLRGLNLGIPYVSPKMDTGGKMGSCCVKKSQS